MRNLRKHVHLISAVAALSLSVGCSDAQPETWPTTYEPDAVQEDSGSNVYTVEPSRELGTFEPSFDD